MSISFSNLCLPNGISMSCVGQCAALRAVCFIERLGLPVLSEVMLPPFDVLYDSDPAFSANAETHTLRSTRLLLIGLRRLLVDGQQSK